VPGLDIVLASADVAISRRARVFADQCRRAVQLSSTALEVPAA